MKFNLKKYIYLYNLVSALLAMRSRRKDEKKSEKLRSALCLVSIILFLSLALNLYFIIKIL